MTARRNRWKWHNKTV